MFNFNFFSKARRSFHRARRLLRECDVATVVYASSHSDYFIIKFDLDNDHEAEVVGSLHKGHWRYKFAEKDNVLERYVPGREISTEEILSIFDSFLFFIDKSKR
jgi:hypothetical protein